MSPLEIVVIGLFCIAGYLIFKTVIDVWSQDKNQTMRDRAVAEEPSGTKNTRKKLLRRILFLVVVPCSYLVYILVGAYLIADNAPVKSGFGAALTLGIMLFLFIVSTIGYYIIYAIISSFSSKNRHIYNIVLVLLLFIFPLLHLRNFVARLVGYVISSLGVG